MRLTRSTIITGLAALVLLAAIPSAVREALESGRIYLFSWEFLADLPARLTGPGRFRFVLQPAMAILLGVRGGLSDARAGRPPYLFGVLFDPLHRREYVRTGLRPSGTSSLSASSWMLWHSSSSSGRSIRARPC